MADKKINLEGIVVSKRRELEKMATQLFQENSKEGFMKIEKLARLIDQRFIPKLIDYFVLSGENSYSFSKPARCFGVSTYQFGVLDDSKIYVSYSGRGLEFRFELDEETVKKIDNAKQVKYSTLDENVR